MIDLNKIIPWLSIRSKLIIAFVGLSVLPVLLVGLYGINTNTRVMKQAAVKDLSHDLSTVRNRSANFMSTAAGDLRLIGDSFLVRQLLHEIDRPNHIADPTTVRLLDNELLSLAKTRRMYYQIRIVDEFGNELVRVQARTPDTSRKSFAIVSAPMLRHTPEAFYTLLVDSLTKGQFAFAPAELIGLGGKIVPVMSFAMPLFSHGKQASILIADVFAKDFFSSLNTFRSLKAGEVIVLVSGDGHYLYHSKEKNNWDELLADRGKYNLKHDYAEDIRDVILSRTAGTVIAANGEIISHSPLFPRKLRVNDAGFTAGFTMPLYIFDAVPESVIMAPVHSYALKLTGLLILILIISTSLSMLATRQFTVPIADLQEGADIIAKGNYNYRVSVDTGDEIEDLAERFNQMAASLHAREREIERYRTHLEDTVESRTSELSAEKSKLQAILDNVPSAFLLLDKDLRIQTTSSAFTKITGYSPEEVRGQECQKIFGANGLCENCICQQALRYGRVESRVTQRPDGKHKEKFIEHTAIPMKEGGRVQAVLAVLTDITRRKHLEQRLVQTEKLVAAGEIAALIAHEFRNSLTSIKMILQLLKESDGLSRSEKKSLGVALNSTGDMESVVSELLNYASTA
ncbi:MAG: PAS domain S-box protein, partial [Bacteroidetes bacterium]|nr:PAS domain S-box protein [Bacteroidota bacterium]